MQRNPNLRRAHGWARRLPRTSPHPARRVPPNAPGPAPRDEPCPIPAPLATRPPYSPSPARLATRPRRRGRRRPPPPSAPRRAHRLAQGHGRPPSLRARDARRARGRLGQCCPQPANRKHRGPTSGRSRATQHRPGPAALGFRSPAGRRRRGFRGAASRPRSARFCSVSASSPKWGGARWARRAPLHRWALPSRPFPSVCHRPSGAPHSTVCPGPPCCVFLPVKRTFHDSFQRIPPNGVT